MKKTIIICVILMISFFLFSISDGGGASAVGGTDIRSGDIQTAIECIVVKGAYQQARTIVYKNTQYGFEFTLPASWKNYKIITGEWEGMPSGSDTPVETGPTIIIRHPLWTEAKPRQDIPVMVFTLEQWAALQQEKFHIGAAPIGPSELGRNAAYVFALPARYNYAFPAGFEEVEKILNGKPLKPIEISSGLNQ